jgi:3-hydroxyacyl-[acyl-carrier-protein] dehydratase
MTESISLDIMGVRRLLPHRYPFLLVDKVLECVKGERIKAIKNVTFNEPFFNGHFPGHPVMPGVLVIEALAQAGGLLTQLSGHNGEGSIYYLVKVDNARFSKMVVPGDRLELEVTLKRTIRNMALYVGVARVDGQEAASAEILCAEVKSNA